jgi:DNA ligase-1
MGRRGHPRDRPLASAARCSRRLVADLPPETPAPPVARVAGRGLGRRSPTARAATSRAIGAEGLMLKRLAAPISPAAKGRLVEMEGRPADHRRGDDLCPGGHGPARQPLHRFHLRGLERQRSGAFHQGLFRPDRRRVRRDHRWVRKNTTERFGPVRAVKPEHVFEIAFEGIQKAPATNPASRCAFRAWRAGARTSRWRRPTRSSDLKEMLAQ